MKWYRKAADQGNAVAQAHLGDCYYSGEGVGQDYAEAVKWYRKGVAQSRSLLTTVPEEFADSLKSVRTSKKEEKIKLQTTYWYDGPRLRLHNNYISIDLLLDNKEQK